MYKWAKAISGKQILSANSWKLAFTPKVNRYGYCWMTGQFSGRAYVRHSGGYPGYMSDFIYYPEKDLADRTTNSFIIQEKIALRWTKNCLAPFQNNSSVAKSCTAF